MNATSRSNMSTSGSVTSPWTSRGSPASAIVSRAGTTRSTEVTPDSELVVAPAG
jgi:hypothetical protein